jgi:hypothetical protein
VIRFHSTPALDVFKIPFGSFYFILFRPFICRLRERPQRPTIVWGMDVSKQIVGMICAHLSGILIAIIAHHATKTAASECAWYFVAFTFDTTIGVALTMFFHKKIVGYLNSSLITPLPLPSANEDWRTAVVDCGTYGDDPPLVRRWALQAGEWSLCVVAARAVCGGVVALLTPLLQTVASGLDSIFGDHPTILLFFVMICCPLLMNAAQLLIQDAILKGRQRGAAEIEDEGRGPLFFGSGQHALTVLSEAKSVG